MSILFHISRCLVVLAVLCTPVYAQLTIAPTCVYIDSETRTGEIMLKNTTKEPREVSVEMKFAYPTTDDKGNLFLKTDDTEAEQYSLVPHVRYFPKKLIVQPGQSQTVKFLLMPKKPLDNAAYWARLHITSKPSVKPVEVAFTDSASAQIVIAVEQVTATILHNGPISTSLDVREVTTLQDPDNVYVLAELERNGNSPFWGQQLLKVYDESGNMVYENLLMISVYYSMVNRMSISKSALPPGNYTAEITINSERTEIPLKNRTRIEPIVRKINFSIQ